MAGDFQLINEQLTLLVLLVKSEGALARLLLLQFDGGQHMIAVTSKTADAEQRLLVRQSTGETQQADGPRGNFAFATRADIDARRLPGFVLQAPVIGARRQALAAARTGGRAGNTTPGEALFEPAAHQQGSRRLL